MQKALLHYTTVFIMTDYFNFVMYKSLY